MQTDERQYWNIVKGIGIVLVVLGHMRLACSGYIYLFHLPLFFFVSGYLYNEEKYGDNPYLLVATRVKSSWIKCAFLYIVLILLHNTFYTYEIWTIGTSLYSTEEMMIRLSEAVFCVANEVPGGTLWFVPVLVITVSLLGFIITLSRKIQRITNSMFLKYLTQTGLILICGISGYFLMLHRVEMMLNLQIVLMVMPFLWGGYLLRNSKCDFGKYLNPFAAVLCGIVVYYVSLMEQLELAFMVVYPYLHLVAFLGIYMCLYLAKLIQRIRLSSKLFEWFGRASFWIMFIHFPTLLLFDWVYTKLVYPDNPKNYLQFMVSYPEFWPVYIGLGLVLPLIEYIAYVKSKEFVVGKLRK